jgi:hypothetical protein
MAVGSVLMEIAMSRMIHVCLLAVLLGCDRQPAVSRRYSLVSVNGRPVPTGVEGGYGDTLRIYEGFAEFRGGDSVMRAEKTAGWRQVDSGRVSLWRHTRTGDSIVVHYDCAPNMHCPGHEMGIMSGDSLVLRASRFNEARLLYRSTDTTRR